MSQRSNLPLQRPFVCLLTLTMMLFMVSASQPVTVAGGQLTSFCSPGPTQTFAYRVRAGAPGLDAVSILSPESVAELEHSLKDPQASPKFKTEEDMAEGVLDGISCSGGDIRECARTTTQAPRPLSLQHWCLVLFNIHSPNPAQAEVDMVWDKDVSLVSSSSLSTPMGSWMAAVLLALGWIMH